MIEKLAAYLRKTPLHPQWLIFRASKKHLAAEIATCSGKVLDIGSADRWPVKYLQQPHEYVGVDFPSTSDRYGYRPTVYADAERLPFHEKSFDFVFAFDVLEHVPGIHSAIREIYRVLKPGGRAIIQIPFAYPLHDEPFDFNRLTEHGLRRGILDAGLHLEAISPAGQPLESACANAAMACAITVRCILSTTPMAIPVRILIGLIVVPIFGSLMITFNLIGRSAASLPGNGVFPIRYIIRAARIE